MTRQGASPTPTVSPRPVTRRASADRQQSVSPDTAKSGPAGATKGGTLSVDGLEVARVRSKQTLAEAEQSLAKMRESVARIQSEMVAATLQRKHLSTTLTSKHPDAVALDNHLAELQLRLQVTSEAYLRELVNDERRRAEAMGSQSAAASSLSKARLDDIVSMQRELERALNGIARQQQQLVEMQRSLAEATAELQRSMAAPTPDSRK